MDGIWTNEGIALLQTALGQSQTIPFTHFALSGAGTVGGLSAFTLTPTMTEATFPAEQYRAQVHDSYIDSVDGHLVVECWVAADVDQDFFTNGIGVIHDEGGTKTLMAIAQVPVQERKLGVFQKFLVKLPITEDIAGAISISYRSEDAITPAELDNAIVGHAHWNPIINGCCRVAQGDPYTLVKDVYGIGQVDKFAGMATGTTVGAGTLTQKLNSTLSVNGCSIHFSGVTLTGTGILYLRQRIEAKNARFFKNQKGSFSGRVLHDVGSNVDVTVYIRKADSENDFSSVTEIANSGAQAIVTDTESDLLFENVSMGDCSNGIEIEIKIEAGAVTTKNFELAEFQLVVGDDAAVFIPRPIAEELLLCQRGPYAADSGTANSYVVDLEPGLWEEKEGNPVRFLPANDNTGASTLNPNALGARDIVRPGGADLQPKDIQAGELVQVVRVGSKYVMQNLRSRFAIRDRFRNLESLPNANNPTYQIDDTIDEVILQDANGYPLRLTDVNETGDISTFGAGGCENLVSKTGTASCSGTTVSGTGTQFQTDFAEGKVIWFDTDQVGRRIVSIASDTSMTVAESLTASSQNISSGGEAPSTWYHRWIIAKKDLTQALFFSLDENPVLPTDYVFSAWLGQIYNDPSGDIRDYHQKDNRVVFGLISALSLGTQTSYTAVDLFSIIPVTAKAFGGFLDVDPTSSGQADTFIAPLADGKGEKTQSIDHSNVVGQRVPFVLPVMESQTTYYKVVSPARMGIGITAYYY